MKRKKISGKGKNYYFINLISEAHNRLDLIEFTINIC